ncbi:MAG: flagellar basal-body rod protein FlgG [Candidatus Eremiobacteraeota bacterium]|nr:flagellar basal-body rod protein FlgG [Candidatus Eremiobacteraeota bacterium]
MLRGLYTAASGMSAQQMNIDNIANNLANIQTTGYKKSRLDFQDLLYSHTQDPGTDATVGTQIGMGVRASATQQIFTDGSLLQTGRDLDVAVQGQGFFEVTLPNNKKAYTRDGAFKMDGQGNLLTGAGYSLGVQIPKDVSNLVIESDGTIKGTPISSTEPKVIGHLTLVRFLNPAGLKSMGSNLYDRTPIAGDMFKGTPGKEGLGTLAQGHLEKANVNVIEEMISIVQAQRAYEMNQKGVQASDEMVRMANQLQK